MRDRVLRLASCLSEGNCVSASPQRLYQLELPLLQFIHGAGTAALVCRLPETQFLDVGWFGVLQPRNLVRRG